MNGLSFDTLASGRRLEGAGFSRQQAVALADEQAKLVDERLATKADIEVLRLGMNSSIREAELRLQNKVAALRNDILKWMVVGAMCIQTVVIVGAVAVLLRQFGH